MRAYAIRRFALVAMVADAGVCDTLGCMDGDGGSMRAYAIRPYAVMYGDFAGISMCADAV